jgi:hypothetical protein
MGFQVFGGYTLVEPGEEKTVVYEYVLPGPVGDLIASGLYTLGLFKQPGAAEYPLTLELEFDTPVVSATPAEPEEERGDSVYRLNTFLDQDKEIVVRF